MNMETGGFGGDDRRRFLVPALIVAAALVVLLLILGISALIRSRSGGSPTATVTRTATKSAPIVGSATAPRSAAPSASGSAAPSSRPSTAPSAAPSTAPAAVTYTIANTGGDNVNLRSDASTEAEVLAKLVEGDQVTEAGPSKTVDGREWKHVRTKDGIEGWVAAEFVTKP
jgi:uncharacterized protein YgiM (DUF1202 family)